MGEDNSVAFMCSSETISRNQFWDTNIGITVLKISLYIMDHRQGYKLTKESFLQ